MNLRRWFAYPTSVNINVRQYYLTIFQHVVSTVFSSILPGLFKRPLKIFCISGIVVCINIYVNTGAALIGFPCYTIDRWTGCKLDKIRKVLLVVGIND